MNNKIGLPIIFGIFGFIISSRSWILFMDKLNPFYGLIVYYLILIMTILILENAGLVIAGINFASFNQALGTICIIFSFFLLLKMESCYMNYVTKGDCKNISNIYLHSEDGATYYLWSKIIDNPEILRLLTYVVTPVVLSFIGVNLITEKVVLTPF